MNVATALPESPHARTLMLHGAIIVTLGLVAGLTVPGAAAPKTVLAAHVIGITAGSMALLIGLVLPHAKLAPALLKAAVWMLLPSLYLGFLTQWIGGLAGLSRMFVVTAAGAPEGNQVLENIMQWIVMGISPITILPFLILGYGLARK